MNIPRMRTGLILELYACIKDCLAEDDNLPQGEDIYGVRRFPDWRECANEFEKELDKREVDYEKIDW